MSSCSQNIFALLIDFLIRGVLTLKSKSINKAHIDTNGHTEPYTHRHTHRSRTNVQINANLQENKPTDWFHNTSTPLCVCLWRKPHSHSGWRGGWWWCVWEGGGGVYLDSSGLALWSWLQISTTSVDERPTTTLSPPHPQPMSSLSKLTHLPLHGNLSVSDCSGQSLLTNIWIVLWKCLNSDCADPPPL